MLYRSMKKDDDGYPLCGENARCLGVRRIVDIPVDENENVKSCTGGMSVFDDPERLPKHRKPCWMNGGEGRDPLFQMNADQIPVELVWRYHGQKAHILVEPAYTCKFNDFLSAIYTTRLSWSEI